MADVHGSPVPSMMSGSLPGPGPEFPRAAADSGAPMYDAGMTLAYGTPGGEVMGDARGGPLQESGYAHDVSAGAGAPYYAGGISPVYVGGDDDAGGRDDVSGTVAGAVAAAEARFSEHQGEAAGTDSMIGDLMNLPAPASGQPGVGAFYDPPRDY